jgi:Family of unknown function (DUF6481)
MRDPLKTGYAERIKTAKEAKQALLAKLKPKTTAQPEEFVSRKELKARELEAARAARAAAKEKALEEAAARAENDLESKRAERKDRKAQVKAEQRARREAKSTARKAGTAKKKEFDWLEI